MDIFLLKLLLAFLVGSFGITLATIIAEKFGTKVGGVISGNPLSIVVALLFIGWTQGVDIASESTAIVPAIIGLDILFILIYLVLAKKRPSLAIPVAIFSWFVLSIGLALTGFNDFGLSVAAFLLLLAFSYYVAEKKLDIPSEGKKSIEYTPKLLLFRALLGGGVIAFAVLASKMGGPVWGGVFSAFPSMMLSAMIITHHMHGTKFSCAFMKVLMIGGGISPAVYAVAVRYAYPALGLVWGTVASFAVAVVSSYLLYLFIRERMR